MNVSELQLLRLLSLGIDIRTGKAVQEGHLLRSELVKNLLVRAADELQSPTTNSLSQGTQQRKAGIAKPDRQGLRWEQEEIETLRREFFAAVDFKEIAKQHDRSRSAIVSQLQIMGLMPQEPPARG